MVNLDSRDEIYKSWILLTIYPNLEPTELPVEMVVLHKLCLALQFKNSILPEPLSVAAPLIERFCSAKKWKVLFDKKKSKL